MPTSPPPSTSPAESRFLQGREAFREAALALARQARRQLLLWTEDLEPGVYDPPDFAQAVVELIKRNRHARCLVLLEDPGWVIKHHHPLVGLAQRLSTFVQIRMPLREYQDHEAYGLIADETGLLERRRGQGYRGSFHPRLPGRARALARAFMEAWESGLAIPDLRHLDL